MLSMPSAIMLSAALVLAVTGIAASMGLELTIVERNESAPLAVDYSTLRFFCENQEVTDGCRVGVQFCTDVVECPRHFICSCMRDCGRLMCMVPPDVKVCASHPPPRDGYSMNRIDTVEFFCDPGFALRGPARKTCRGSIWFPADDFPRCLPVLCDGLPELTNGSTYFSPDNDRRRFNTTATHSCDMGYTLVGESKLTCLDGGIWSVDMPSCKRDGYWTKFSDWGACDARCGRGIQRRVRTCVSPEKGGQPCPVVDAEEIRVCETGQACSSMRLGCFTRTPWTVNQNLIKVQFAHPEVDGVHRCLHRCRNHGTTYATVRGPMDCWCYNQYKVDGFVENCQSSVPLYQVYPVPQALGCYKQVSEVIGEQVPTTLYYSQRFTVKCGWLDWGRCTKHRPAPREGTVTRYRVIRKIVKC